MMIVTEESRETAGADGSWQPSAPPQEGAPVTGTVLVVEDDEYIAELLGYWLRRAGFAIHLAADGLVACSMVAQERPGIVLLDLMLPGLDGREVCRLIRRHRDPYIAATPIIMLSALSTPEDQAGGLLLGADLYLTKPYSVLEVLQATKTLLARRLPAD